MLAGGVAAAISGLLLCFMSPRDALAGWLAAVVGFSAVPAGSLYLVFMMRLIPGVWGEELRLSTEAATLLTPYAALLFIPVLLGLGFIYPWMHHMKTSGFQSVILTPLAFLMITLFRFGALVWTGWRMRQRRSTLRTASMGLIALPLLASVAAVIWLMSLDPKFSSSAFGLQFIEREVTIAFAAALLLRLNIGRPPKRLGVAGSVLLTLLLLWAYIEFMPFLISWSSNLSGSAGWYLERGAGGWSALGWVWVMLSGIPMLSLVITRCRQSVACLKLFAISVLLGKLCEIAWITLPGYGSLAWISFCMTSFGMAWAAYYAMPLMVRQRICARTAARAPR